MLSAEEEKQRLKDLQNAKDRLKSAYKYHYISLIDDIKKEINDLQNKPSISGGG